MNTRFQSKIMRRAAACHLLLAAALSVGNVPLAHGQDTAASEAKETIVTTGALEGVAQKSDTVSTAPAFVPEEVQGIGGRWIVPEESKGEMAVRSAESKQAEPPDEGPKPSQKAPQVEKTAQSVSPSVTPAAGKRTSSKLPSEEGVAPPRKPDEEKVQEESEEPAEETEDKAAQERVPPRPKWVTVSGKVESVKPLPKNELEVTVKSRELGRVKVIVSPLQVQRVPGKGRQIHLRGVVIREGSTGLTIRAMEMNPKDEGVFVPSPVPMSLSVGLVYHRRR